MRTVHYEYWICPDCKLKWHTPCQSYQVWSWECGPERIERLCENCEAEAEIENEAQEAMERLQTPVCPFETIEWGDVSQAGPLEAMERTEER